MCVTKECHDRLLERNAVLNPRRNHHRNQEMWERQQEVFSDGQISDGTELVQTLNKKTDQVVSFTGL